MSRHKFHRSLVAFVSILLPVAVACSLPGATLAGILSPFDVIAEHNRDGNDAPGARGASGNTIDASGFPGLVSVGHDPNDSHNGPANIWYVKPADQGAGANPPETFYYDLGASLPVRSVVFWNQNGSGSTGQPRSQTEIGPVTQLSVATTSGTPAGFTLGDMGGLTWTPAITNQAVSTTVGGGQTLALASPVTTRYLRMTIDAADQGNNDQYAFNEFAVDVEMPIQQTAFRAPPGGWSYMYAANPTEDRNASGAALDGTWDHDNGSDEWDGNRIGSGRPGGAQVITAGDDSFLRVQETGDLRDHGMGDPGSNRKVGFIKDIGSLLPPDWRVLDDGVTLSFRARIATGSPLDDMHPDTAGDGENSGGPVAPWPTEGNGYVIHNEGKGPFGFHQESGTDQTISFGLALPSDSANLGGGQGLVMNDLNGTSPSGNVDQQDNDGGTLNLLPISDPTAFHEYWVTIKADTSGGGTHRVNVYTDGAATPTTFHLTAGTGEDKSYDYMALMHGATPQMGAMDVDFMAFRSGAWAPGEKALVAYYNFDGNADDHSGNALHGTLQGDAAYVSDAPAQLGGGQSITFDGNGDYVDLGNPDQLNFGADNWTVAGWIKTAQPDSDRGTLFSNGGDGGGGVRYTLTQNEGRNGNLRLILDDNSDKVEAETTSDTNDGQWHHIVGIRQGRVMAVYVDGQLQDSNDLPALYDLSGTSQQPAQIGAGRQQSDSSLIKQLVGQIDDVAVWRVTLPHAVIQGLAEGDYNPLAAPMEAPLPDFLPPGTKLSDFLNIDLGPDGQRVEPGFVGLPGAPGNGTGGTNYPTTLFTTATDDVVALTLDTVDQNGNAVGGLDWRDRGNSDNAGFPLVLVGEDHIKNNLGVVRATLEGVPEGSYLVTSYFLDAENSQSEAIKIYLSDAAGSNVLQDDLGDASYPGGNPGGSGEHLLTTNLLDAHSVSFLMLSDGIGPIQMIFNGSQALDDEMPLAGLTIQRAIVPEPGSWLLLALGGLGLLFLRRRQK